MNFIVQTKHSQIQTREENSRIREINMEQEKSKDESQARLKDLRMVIEQVYLPTLEEKPDIKHTISKFSTQINTALQQAYGNVTITVPKIPASDEEVQKSGKHIESLNKAVVSPS